MSNLIKTFALCATLSSPVLSQSVLSVDWASNIRTLKTVPAFQTVVNSLTTRVAPQHDAIFNAIATLGAQYQRFVPWLPYPRLGLLELEPPSQGSLCGFVNSGGSGNVWSTTLDCGSRNAGTIDGVVFANYGTPTGYCNSLQASPSCTKDVSSIVSAACVGKASCTLTSNDETFGTSPCSNSRLAVEVTCSNKAVTNFSYYNNFDWPDQGMIDFMVASGNGSRTAIPNFSTPPQWLYDNKNRVLFPDDPLECFWSYESGNALVDQTAQTFGDYYGRLLAHYTEGGFIDEAGNQQPGYNFNITHWEVLNEIEGEHADKPEQYVKIYDAVVTSIRKFAPTASKTLKFVGLALESDSDFSQATYFINASNHAPGIPLDVFSFHFYAGSSRRDGGDAGSTYEEFFSAADNFLNDAKTFMSIRDAINPSMLIDADELGVILPDDNNPVYTSDEPGFPNVFWNAAAALYGYEYGSLSVSGLDVVGMSQLVGYPSLNITRTDNGKIDLLEPQFPSVAMLNWTDGSGTARYWALKLIIDSLTPFSDVVVNTTVSTGPSSGTNPFCGSIINLATLDLQCVDPTATISKINFASYGTPTGSCGSWQVGACNAANSTAIVEAACLNQNKCSIDATTPIFGDPCYDVVKYLDVVATCTGSSGGFQPTTQTPVFAQAYLSPSGTKKVLVVNKNHLSQTIQVPPELVSAQWSVVDEASGFGPARVETVTQPLTLAPFAVGVITLA